jgi:hypothetical protein
MAWNLRRIPFALVVACGLAAAPGTTPVEHVVYDNGSPVRGAGFYSVSYAIAADDFVLDAPGYQVVALSRVFAYMVDSTSKPWDGKTVQWWILEDNAGLPGNVRASGFAQNPTVIYEPYTSDATQRSFTIDFALHEPIRLATGKRYWLALHLAIDTSLSTVVTWNGTEPVRGIPALPGGDLVGGAPDFTGVNTAPWNRQDRAFRLFGDYVEPGYADTATYPSERTRLHGVLAEWCKVERSLFSLPELACNFPWDVSVNLDQAQAGLEKDPAASQARYLIGAGGRTGAPREELRIQMFQLFRTGATPEAFGAAVQRISSLIGDARLGSYFDANAKAAVLASLRSARKADLALARALAEAVNAIELDVRFPPVASVDVAAGAVVDLGGAASVSFQGVREPGKLALQVRKDAELPKSLRGCVVGWPFCTYHFQFGGKLAAPGYVDLNINLERARFPGRLRDLRVLEFDAQSWRDVTVGVDEKLRLITARTNALSNYVVAIPPSVR